MEKAVFAEEISCRSANKKLRLFGLDLQCVNGDHHSRNDDLCERKTEDQKVIMLMNGKRKCPFCEKEFTNSQALGGHQNAHKKERMIKKRSLLEERKASLEFYLQSLESLAPASGSSNTWMVGSGFRSFSSSESVCYQEGSHGFDLYALQIYVPY